MAYRYDRNCVLASTAGQVMMALELGQPIHAIVFGESAVRVGIVAKAVTLADASETNAAVIGGAGIVAFYRAADMPLVGIEDDDAARISEAIIITVDSWIADGRLAALIRTLGNWTTPGLMTELGWLKPLMRPAAAGG